MSITTKTNGVVYRARSCHTAYNIQCTTITNVIMCRARSYLTVYKQLMVMSLMRMRLRRLTNLNIAIRG